MIERGMHLYLNFQLSSFVKLSDLYFDVAATDAIKTIMASKKSMDAHEDMHVGQGRKRRTAPPVLPRVAWKLRSGAIVPHRR